MVESFGREGTQKGKDRGWQCEEAGSRKMLDCRKMHVGISLSESINRGGSKISDLELGSFELIQSVAQPKFSLWLY